MPWASASLTVTPAWSSRSPYSPDLKAPGEDPSAPGHQVQSGPPVGTFSGGSGSHTRPPHPQEGLLHACPFGQALEAPWRQRPPLPPTGLASGLAAGPGKAAGPHRQAHRPPSLTSCLLWTPAVRTGARPALRSLQSRGRKTVSNEQDVVPMGAKCSAQGRGGTGRLGRALTAAQAPLRSDM